MLFLGSLSSVLFGLWLLLLGAGVVNTPSQRLPLVFLSGMLSLVLAGYGFYVFYLLVRKRRTAPKHAQRFLIFGLLRGILDILAFSMMTHSFAASVVALALDLPGLLGCLLWLCYLGSSQRVANTYAKPASGLPRL